jgi:CPA1 family monovalent cation:H+ antiporter
MLFSDVLQTGFLSLQMQLYHTFIIVVVLAALFGYINYRFIKLPGEIGIMVLSIVTSLVIIVAGYFKPATFEEITGVIRRLNFSSLLMNFMLSFLLFAGAIHIDAKKLKTYRLAILTFSTIGVLISTLIIGGLLFACCLLLGIKLSFIYCLLFGSIVSPTDPIAVLSILKKARIPASLEIKITGESLFNDGVAIVVFITIYYVIEGGIDNLSGWKVAGLFMQQAGGGVLLGALLGYCGFLLMRSIDYYKVEVMITVAIVMGGYLLAETLHVSGPLAMVVAGIITGNKSRGSVMSAVTRDYIDKFWEIVDEMLNAILFILIGFEMLIISFNTMLLLLGIITIGIVLLARYISVLIPTTLLRFKTSFEKNAITLLTWGGLRGGLSVALALSLPSSMHGELFVSITYIVVMFSIIVQGLTIGRIAKKLSA